MLAEVLQAWQLVVRKRFLVRWWHDDVIISSCSENNWWGYHHLLLSNLFLLYNTTTKSFRTMIYEETLLLDIHASQKEHGCPPPELKSIIISCFSWHPRRPPVMMEDDPQLRTLLAHGRKMSSTYRWKVVEKQPIPQTITPDERHQKREELLAVKRIWAEI